jgi:hypothetical protein
MITHPIFYSILLCLSFFGLKSDTEKDIIGYWNLKNVSDDNIYEYERLKSFKENDGGIAFLADGKYINRNSGPCGTPPRHYSNHEGKWDFQAKKVVIDYDHWMGPEKTSWEIISVDKGTLKLRKIGK